MSTALWRCATELLSETSYCNPSKQTSRIRRISIRTGSVRCRTYAFTHLKEESRMIRTAKAIAITIGLVAFCSATMLAQGPPPTILRIDVENFVRYVEDIADPSRYATNTGITPASVPKNFGEFLAVADIVAVNDVPAKGTYSSRGRNINMTPAPNSGQAI